MGDKGLGMGLAIIFGATGMAVLGLAWLIPPLHMDKVMSTLGGMFGVGMAAIQARKIARGKQSRREPVEVEIEE